MEDLSWSCGGSSFRLARRSQRFQDFFEALVADGDALVHRSLEHHIASFTGLVEYGEGESGEAIFLGAADAGVQFPSRDKLLG